MIKRKDERLITVAEASKLLRVSEQTLRTMIKGGQFEFAKVAQYATTDSYTIYRKGLLDYVEKYVGGIDEV